MAKNATKSNLGIFYSNQSDVKNHKGLIWRAWDEEIVVNAGANYNFGLRIGAKPVELSQLVVISDSVLAKFDIYQGGVYSAGSPLPNTSLNRDNLVIIPLNNLSKNVTIDTAGDLVFPNFLRGVAGVFGTAEVTRTNSHVGLILKRNTDYYFNLVNSDASTRTFDVYITLSSHEQPS